MFFEVLFLVIGFALLIKGADFLVDGSSSLARRFGVSELVIGLTIVAFGTSTPELVVNLAASFSGNTEIAVGNVLGSNIANILLILGISSIIFPLTVTSGTVWKEIPLSLLAAIVLAFMANDVIFDNASASVLTRIDGLVFLAFFLIFLYYTFGIAKAQNNNKVVLTNQANQASKPVLFSVFFVLAGLAFLYFGGSFVVDNSVFLAKSFGLSESLIGLTIVAVGTSLPELFTSAIAALKKNSDIAIGNIVGSNIFNIFFILGVSAVVRPLSFNTASNVDIFMVIVATVLLFGFMFIGKRHVIEKWNGAAFLFVYLSYVLFLVWRG